MAYSKFTIKKLENLFDIKRYDKNFINSNKIKPSNRLKLDLEDAFELKPRSEKAKSELIISPILLEIRRNNNKKFFIYSGENLDIDPKNDLNGECDFILSKKKDSLKIQTPIFAIAEAKRDSISSGDIAQVIAQMIGAYILNKQDGNNYDIIFGAVTTGYIWQFLKLEVQENEEKSTYLITIEEKNYYINQLEEILGALQEIIDIIYGK